MRNKRIRRLAASLTISFAAAASTGCATIGGSPLHSQEQQNTHQFKSYSSLETKMDKLKVGMSKKKVCQIIGIGNPDQDLPAMKPSEVYKTLYGNVALQAPFEKRAEVQKFFNGLKGYWVRFSNVTDSKSFGLTSSTNSYSGYNVTYPLIFNKGVLYNNVSKDGGPVNKRSQNGYFNDMTPKGILHLVK